MKRQAFVGMDRRTSRFLTIPGPQPKTQRDYTTLCRSLNVGPNIADRIRDRMKLWIEQSPMKARVGALAKATLDRWALFYCVKANEEIRTRWRFCYGLTLEGLEALDAVVVMASCEPSFSSELAAAVAMFEREARIGINGIEAPYDEVLTAGNKAVGLYSPWLFGMCMVLGGTPVRTRSEINAALSKLKHGSLP